MILISGEALIDLIPDAEVEGRYDAKLGGSPYNVAIGLARLGVPTGFVSRISKDANGEALARALLKDGVDLATVARDARPSPLAFVMRKTATEGERYSFYIDATAFDGPWPFPAQWPAEARHLHIGSFSALIPLHLDAVVSTLARVKGGPTVSFDPNIRPMVTPERAPVVAACEKILGLVDFVKASDEDLQWLYPDRSPESTLEAWSKSGPRFCIATLGALGSVAFCGGERFDVPGRIISFVDSVGAGDSFMSGLIAAMDADGALGKPGVPDAALFSRWLDFASSSSAITCTRKGSNPPTRDEVTTLLLSGKKGGVAASHRLR